MKLKYLFWHGQEHANHSVLNAFKLIDVINSIAWSSNHKLGSINDKTETTSKVQESTSTVMKLVASTLMTCINL